MGNNMDDATVKFNDDATVKFNDDATVKFNYAPGKLGQGGIAGLEVGPVNSEKLPPSVTKKKENQAILDTVEFFKKLDSANTHIYECQENNHSLQDLIDKKMITPDTMIGIVKTLGNNINPYQVFLPTQVLLNEKGKDVFKIYSEHANVSDVIGQRAHSFFDKMSGNKDFMLDVKKNKMIFENITGLKTTQQTGEWYANIVVAYACLKKNENIPFTDPMKKNLDEFKNYSNHISELVDKLKVALRSNLIDETFIENVRLSVCGDTTDWQKIQDQYIQNIKVAQAVYDPFEKAGDKKMESKILSQFEERRVVNQLNVKNDVIEKIAETLNVDKADVFKLANDYGAAKFANFLNVNFNFTFDGQIKDSLMKQELKEEIRLNIRTTLDSTKDKIFVSKTTTTIPSISFSFLFFFPFLV